MPLKPILDKAPLTAMTCQPLCAGLVRSDASTLAQLYALAASSERATSLEGAFRLACIVTSRPDEEPVAARIRAALATQREDGSFPACIRDSIAILRAAWALYEYETRKPTLEHIARWCAWAAQNWTVLMEDDDVWASSADLLELLENLYRVTGKAALLKLCDQLTEDAMPWSSVLNTISVQRPCNRAMTSTELVNGLAAENGSREGYYTHFSRTHTPEQLADGARATMTNAWYSGSATEFSAARNSWERLYRHHGAVCGGLTSDELLEGTSPAMAVSTAALGAWAEALCAASLGDNASWAFDALERMAFNAMPAALVNGKLSPFQRVNTLCADASCGDCFHVSEDHADRALDRLVRGYAAVYSHAVTALASGFAINLYLPGKYAVPMGDQLLMFSIVSTGKGFNVTLHCKNDVKASLRLRIPEWSRNTDVTINGIDHDAGRDCTAGYMRIDRTWHDGDVLQVSIEQTLRMAEGHHQGKYLLKGPVLMALSAEPGSDWALSMLAPMQEGDQTGAQFDLVADWKCRDNIPADIPVLPAASGNAPVTRWMTPYATTPARIALFPGRKNA